MKTNQLTEILTQHSLWLETNGKEGSRADLQNADLQNADLQEADLRWADLQNADLRKADLRKADLQWADLRNADLQEANLLWTDLQNADLQGVDFPGLEKIKEGLALQQQAKQNVEIARLKKQMKNQSKI